MAYNRCRDRWRVGPGPARSLHDFPAEAQMDDRLPLTHSIARDLQDAIRAGELKPGAKLPSQRVLSRRFGVSRASLREALLMLETLGLVRTLPARGTVVVGPDGSALPATPWRYAATHRIADVFQTRLLLEPELCRLAAPAITAQTLATLDATTVRFETGWRQGDLVAHVEADLAFHRLIAEACPNAMLRQIYLSVQAMLSESQRQPIPHTATDRMEASIAEHRRIAEGLRAGDGTAAAAAMRAHVANTARCAGVALD
jgi:GntR family transcriptional repressor for pyruvate dehydrogenase complex